MKDERITDKGRIIAAVLGALLLILLCSYALCVGESNGNAELHLHTARKVLKRLVIGQR